MFIKLKFITLTLFTILILVMGCGIQPERAVQGPQSEQTGNTHSEEEYDNEEDDHDQLAELSAVELAAGEKLKVVVTTNIVGDLVRIVGGDMVVLTTMLPIGADPHTFSPAPQDVAAAANAHVVFINGLRLEEFLKVLIENAGNKAPTVALSANVETHQLERAEGRDEDGHAAEDEHGHAGVDPHIWMSPANARVMVRNVAHALSELDPANAAAYKANAEAYEAELEELDAWVTEQIAAIPEENRKLVTDHSTFGYYAERYGLEMIGAVLPGYSTISEPSAQELAALQDAIEQYGVKAVFVGTTVNPVLAQRITEDTGIKLVPLYTGSLGKTGSGAETYIDYIRYNTHAIVEALK